MEQVKEHVVEHEQVIHRNISPNFSSDLTSTHYPQPWTQMHPGYISQNINSCCDQCGSNSLPYKETSVHIQSEHELESHLTTIHCTFCNQTFHDMRHLNIHVKEHHGPNSEHSVEENLSLTNQSLSDVCTLHTNLEHTGLHDV